MRVLLSSTPGVRAFTCIPDIGLGYLATSLRKSGHDVYISQREKDQTLDGFLSDFKEINPDILGMKVFSSQIGHVKKTIEKLKKINPSLLIVLGGPHISAVSSEHLVNEFPDVGLFIRGEGEVSLRMLVDTIERGGDFSVIPGIVMKRNGKIIQSLKATVENIDSLGIPAWDLIPPGNYNDRWHFWMYQLPGAPILTSRGCPYRCAFCAQDVIAGKKFRQRNLALVFEEMELLYNQYGVRDFDIIDDNFLMDPEYVERFCHGILKNNWTIRWVVAGARLDHINKSLIKLMDKAGCYVISVGIESGSQRLLDYMLKDTNVKDIHAKIDLIKHQSSIKVLGMFIIGYPTETVEEILQTVRFACRLPLIAASFFTYIILPGCKQYKRLVASGEVSEVPWSKICADGHEYVPLTMTKNQLKLLFKWAYIRFYFRPHILFRMLFYSIHSYKRLWRLVLDRLFRWNT